jgi:hypothetical protein
LSAGQELVDPGEEHLPSPSSGAGSTGSHRSGPSTTSTTTPPTSTAPPEGGDDGSGPPPSDEGAPDDGGEAAPTEDDGGATLADPRIGHSRSAPSDTAHLTRLARYLDAFERFDVELLVALLCEETHR